MKSDRQDQMISIVIPIYNEEDNINKLCLLVTDIMKSIGKSFEIIFVDDGSTDSSFNILRSICRDNEKIKAISLSRNFGHQVAITAGMDFARGEAVIMMDGDLQHPPELIPELLDKWEQGYEVVYTIRKETRNIGLLKKWSSKGFYKIINYLSGTYIPEDSADFRLLDKKVVNDLKDFNERSRFIRGLVSWVGYRQKGLVYKANPRLTGKSKYSFRKMLKFAFDGITSFSSTPLYISAFLGLAVSGISFIYGLYVIYAAIFTDKVIPGWASIVVVVLFLGGIQLISLGIIGAYLGRVFNEVKKRPLYLINKTLGFNDKL